MNTNIATPRKLPADLTDRAVGCLLGLAVGDALGATLEFSARDTYPIHREMIGGGPFDLPPGHWTDDTAMTLALADSLITCRCFDPYDLMTRFVSWWQEGEYSSIDICFDIGITTREALQHFTHTGNPFAGRTDPDTAGNGSLMRSAPVALYSLGDEAEAIRIARNQSLTTHAAPQAVEGCELLVILLREAILGQRDVLQRRLWSGHPEIRRITTGTWRNKSRGRIRSSGYVVSTLEAALWSLGQTNSFEDALVTAVNLGHDADTVGAVTGQLAGALYGASSIPSRWLKPLAWRDEIKAMAIDLLFSGDGGHNYSDGHRAMHDL